MRRRKIEFLNSSRPSQNKDIFLIEKLALLKIWKKVVHNFRICQFSKASSLFSARGKNKDRLKCYKEKPKNINNFRKSQNYLNAQNPSNVKPNQ